MNSNKNLPSDNGFCNCGCGQTIGKKSKFAQGHDARFVSELVTNYLAADKNSGQAKLIIECVQYELSDALEAKFWKQYDRAVIKAEVKSAGGTVESGNKLAKAAKSTPRTFEVKVGRWTYPATKSNGKTYRNTKRDGSGEWVLA
jgi:hypothetical protein